MPVRALGRFFRLFAYLNYVAQSYIERAGKYTPNTVKVFLAPMLVILITPLGLIVFDL